jgi:CelD/BcsL family acetyltransferase involved in cellulose biosynthesis
MIAATFAQAAPCFLTLVDQNGHCCGGVAIFLVKSWLTGTRLVSIPWACYADPLVRSQDEFARLFEQIVVLAEKEKAAYIEIRTRDSEPILRSANVMTPSYSDKTHHIDLTSGLSAVWDGLHKTRIRQPVGKAERMGIEIRVATSEQEVTALYRIFVTHRRRLGLPPQKSEYFRNIWTYAVPVGLARFLLAYAHDRLVGGLCYFCFRGKAFWSYVCAEQSATRLGVGQLLTWTMIRMASEEGLTMVDLGRTPPDAKGLLQYKRAWGGVERQPPVFYYPRPMGLSVCEHREAFAYRAFRAFWRVTPPALSRIAGRFFYRHTG